MNILILTPDGVGSTILQRISTLALHLDKQDVVNCHELTNGLIVKDSKVYKDFSFEYNQSLEEIISILSKSQSGLVSRLAKYHIDNRRDDISHQTKFYDFLKMFNDKILVCKRKNLFEYAMSWSIRNKSNIFNIYNKKDREAVKQIDSVDSEFFLKKCKEYVLYENWIDENFKNFDTVYYEDFTLDPDKKIKDLLGIDNVFEKHFGGKLADIFRKEYLVSNRYISLDQKEEFLPLLRYKEKTMWLEKNNILPAGTAAPIKNTTLQDKKNIVKNYDQCRQLFLEFSRQHNWIDTTIIDYDFWNNIEIQ